MRRGACPTRRLDREPRRLLELNPHLVSRAIVLDQLRTPKNVGFMLHSEEPFLIGPSRARLRDNV